MKKIWKNFIVILAFIMMPSVVLAKPDAPKVDHVDADLYMVKSNSDTRIAYFLVGQDIDHVDTYGAVNNAAYISVPNGEYSVWAEDEYGDLSSPTDIEVTASCNNRNVINATGSGTAERCFVVNENKQLEETTSEAMVTCAKGYYLEQGATAALYNDCERKTFIGYNLSFRYCKKTFQYKCAKVGTVSNLKLATLSISTGDLTPAFSSTNYVYSAETTESSVAVSATLQDNSNDFEKGFGPRTVDLDYGLNKIYIKPTSSNGSKIEYLIKLTRKDNRDANNRLSSLSIDGVDISPKFNENTLAYSAKVSKDTNMITINANLSSNNSSFVNNYGPRKVNLNDGYNKVQIKVRSQSGAVRVYTITVLKGDAPVNNNGGNTGNNNNNNNVDPNQNNNQVEDNKSKALLENLSLSDGIITFDPNVFDYNVAWKVILAICLITIGCMIIFKSFWGKKNAKEVDEKIKKLDTGNKK